MEAGKLTVSFGIDVSALKTGLAVAKAELTSFASEVSAKTSASVKTGLNSISEFVKNASAKVSQGVKDILASLKRLEGIGAQMESAGGTLSAALSIPLAAAGGFALKLSGDLEKAALSFRVLTKDAGTALALQKELVKFSAQTPFEFADVQKGAKQLLAYGFAVGDVTKYLKTAGDLAAGMDVNITEVTSSLGRLKSGNFGEAFERLRELGIDRTALEGAGLKFDKGGSYVGSVKDAMTAVETVINSKFGGMTEKLSTSFPGMLATAWDNVQLTLSEIGTSIINAFDLKGALGSFSSGLDTIKNGFLSLSPTTQKFVLGLGALAIAIPPILAGFGVLTSTIIPAVVTGFGAIISPIGLTVAAIAGAAALIIYHWDSVKTFIGNVQIFTHIKDVVKSMFGAIVSIFGVFYNLFTGDWANMWEHMKNVAKYAWNGIVSLLQTGLLGIETVFAKLVGLVSPSAGKGLQKFFEESIKGFDSIKVEVPPLTNAINTVKGAYDKLSGAATNFGSSAKKAGADATKALLEASDARIKAGLDAIKHKETDNKHGVISGIDVYQMAPIRDVKITPASNIFPDLSNAIDTKVLADKLKEASDNAIEVLKQSQIESALEEKRDSIRGAFEGMFSGWNVSGMGDALKTSLDSVSQMTQEQLSKLDNMINILPNIANSLSSGFQAMGEAFVNGGNPFEAFGRSIISSFGDILMQIGQQMLKQAAALVALAIVTQGALSPVAIRTGIAGGALVAAGAALKASSSSKRSYASGWGGAYGPTNMVFGDHAGRSIENPEYVLRHDQVKSILNRAADNAGGGKGGFVAETVIRGADLRVLLKRAETLATS